MLPKTLHASANKESSKQSYCPALTYNIYCR